MEQRNAVVMGRVDIKPKPVNQTPDPRTKRQSRVQRQVQSDLKKEDSAREEKHKDQKRFGALGNQQMLEELHWAKSELRKLQERHKALEKEYALLRANVKALMEELEWSVPSPKGTPEPGGFARIERDSSEYIVVAKAFQLKGF